MGRFDDCSDATTEADKEDSLMEGTALHGVRYTSLN